MLQPTVRRTWAPRGQTPILESYDRHDRLTAVSAVTVSPQRRRLGLVFDLLDHNLATADFELFVERLLRKIRGPITMVIDRLGAHRSAAKRLLVTYPARLAFEWLWPYSPDLNPTEHVWGHTKYSRLDNFIPDDPLHLGRSVSDALRKTRREQRLLRSFFRQAELDL
jgi:transposase